MTARIVSISAAPYDGHPLGRMLDSLATIGARWLEPAYIVGYTEPFDETAFTIEKARAYEAALRASGIGCVAFSSHIDLGRDDAVEVFRGRMDFAKHLGVRVINTNAAARRNESRFFENIAVLARHAEALDMLIGLENPGDGSDNLLNTAADAPGLLARIGHPRVGLNYDAGNTISHRPGGVVPSDDALQAMPLCLYTHVKDVRADADGFFFTPIGEGNIDCTAILGGIAATSIDCSIEIPLRLYRGPDAQPVRAAAPVPIAEIERVIGESLRHVERYFEAWEQSAGV
jgi:sugar phosphate isomerase/epimerase